MGRLLPLPTHCRFPPGGQLPPWRDLAERFGVGRDAAREAIAVLGAVPAVERRPTSGIYQRAVDRQGSLDALVLQAEFGVPPGPRSARWSSGAASWTSRRSTWRRGMPTGRQG
jgi:GntR family transcriptional repressor for pyruvate dehydrogenase complex